MEEQKCHITVDDLDGIRDLVEAGMQDEADQQFAELAARFKRDSMYSAVGELTRDLHDSIVKFTEDDRIRVIANVEMPDASERLKNIIEMTSDAANKTLDAVDACVPKIQDMISKIDKLTPEWKELMSGKIDRFTFVSLCHSIDELIDDATLSARKIEGELNSIMMAQGYQDLTGQMLQKVIRLVTEVEDKLVDFLVSFGADRTSVTVQPEDTLAPAGPATTAREKASVAESQDEVDDLLASLGF